MIPIKFRSNEICEEEERMVMKKTAKAASLILVGAMMMSLTACGSKPASLFLTGGGQKAARDNEGA